MAIEYLALKQAFNGLTIGEFQMINIMAVVAIFLVTLAITRNKNMIQILQLPVAAAFAGAGFSCGYIPLIIYTILFSINTLNIGNIMGSLTAGFNRTLPKLGLKK